MTNRTRRDTGRNDVRGEVPALRKKAGRPSKLTPELQEKLCRAIRAGNFINISCALTGCSPRSTQIWRKRGLEDGRGVFFEFALAIEQALAYSDACDLAVIQAAAAAGEWRAACWVLERRFSERWGQQSKVAHEHAGQKVVVRVVRTKAEGVAQK